MPFISVFPLTVKTHKIQDIFIPVSKLIVPLLQWFIPVNPQWFLYCYLIYLYQYLFALLVALGQANYFLLFLIVFVVVGFSSLKRVINYCLIVLVLGLFNNQVADHQGFFQRAFCLNFWPPNIKLIHNTFLTIFIFGGVILPLISFCRLKVQLCVHFTL